MYIPPGFGTVTPYFTVRDAESFISFLVHGLGGEELLRTVRPDGRIANVQVRLGTSTVMVSEAEGKWGPTAASYYFFVEDAHATMKSAVANGATVVSEVGDRDYGDRQGGVRDPHGNIWWVSQRIVEEPYKP